jgi:hypothetical protein
MVRNFALLLLMLCAFAFTAENKPGMAGKNDSLMHKHMKIEKQEMQPGMMGRMMEHQEMERQEMGSSNENRPGQEPCEEHGMGMGMPMHRMGQWDSHWENYSHHLHMAKRALMMLCLCMMLMAAVINVLLTILVTLDMSKGRHFNGLWIPLVLIAGVPATGLYALFRIGDHLSEEKK